jgi:cytochrome o ubiquinol oxidase subunit II
MPKNRKRNNLGRTVACIVLALIGLAAIIAVLLQGNNVALFHSKGMIAHEQRSLMITTLGIMLVIAIPALFLFFFTAWKYRESNSKAAHDPEARYGKFFVASFWLAPSAIAVVLAAIMWPAAHQLDPKTAITADVKPLTVQVVALRWKWLFIYPEQHIATVNFVQVPEHTPVRFELTADEAPMSSFWIPNLGGQLYAMTGHKNQINLIGDTRGDYTGSSAEINGAGFADMKFTTRISSQEAFDFWVRKVQLTGGTLDATAYDELVKPSEDNPTAFYAVADTQNDLYDTVLMKYMAPSDSDRHMNREMHQ